MDEDDDNHNSTNNNNKNDDDINSTSGMKTSLQHLSGIALIDTTCKPEVIWYFDEMELPEDLKERFRVLFQTREKWTLDEIRPYVQ
uniref:Sister chromatid cohesion protein DCC1 n=1 Tax=Timema genevievae TaxID=629358 RepID=A0A7R9K972_TIMGE|nr:unnamed protein product [Timema genevievae]